MAKIKIQCPVCEINKFEDLFDHDLGICTRCAEKAHQAALDFSARLDRDKNAPASEHRARVDSVETHRTAGRDKAPPRAYPYPWRAK